MSIKINIPADTKELELQIMALEIQIQDDTREKDKAIHKEALEQLKEELKKRRQKYE